MLHQEKIKQFQAWIFLKSNQKEKKKKLSEVIHWFYFLVWPNIFSSVV